MYKMSIHLYVPGKREINRKHVKAVVSVMTVVMFGVSLYLPPTPYSPD